MKSTPEFESELKPHPKAAQFVRQQIETAVASNNSSFCREASYV